MLRGFARLLGCSSGGGYSGLGGLPTWIASVLVGVALKKSVMASAGHTGGVGFVARPKYVTFMWSMNSRTQLPSYMCSAIITS
jgi:hypothetical protein